MDVDLILKDSKLKINQFRDQNPDGIVVIWWATATGKTWLSVLLSQFLDMEIISADSRQIFAQMDIWTDKVSQEIRDKLPHHQLDIVMPDQSYTAWQRKKDSEKRIDDILFRNKIPFVVGGTGLYIDTLYKNYSMPEVWANMEFRNKLFLQEEKSPWYLHQELERIDPVEAQRHHPNSTRYIVRALEIFHETGKLKSEICKELPVRWPILMIGLWRDKESTNLLIDQRIDEMLAWWLVDEVQWLLDMWYDPGLQAMQWIGYKEVVEYLQWKCNKEQMKENLQLVTHRLAKKQRTWFRRYMDDAQNQPKENVEYLVYGN